MLQKRHGSTLTAAIVMTGVIFAVGTAMVSMVSGQKRKAENERWQSTAEDAAQTGLSMVLAWARASAERTRAMPRAWDVADATILNPLASYFEDESFTTQRHGLAINNRNSLGDLSVAPPDVPVPGDIVAMNADGTITPGRPGEFVVSTFGNHVVSTFRPRMQVFRMDDEQARLYKITISGRVYRYNKPSGANAGPAPFQNWNLVADRVLTATTGRLPLSRFATLIDVDLVRNWVPGEISDGPIHVNRGYVDAAGGLRPTGVNLANGRSQMMLNAPGAFGNVNGFDRPVFRDTVSFTHRTTALVPPPAAPAADMVDNPIGAGGNPLPGPIAAISTVGGTAVNYMPGRPKGGQIFTSPDNASGLQGGPGPILLREAIEMPTNSRGRFIAALGLGAGVNLNLVNWLQNLRDGLYIPSANMAANPGATSYGATPSPSGGVYIRGNVEVMRMATREVPAETIYAFQVGGINGAGNYQRRVYTLRVSRNNSGAITLGAHPVGSVIGSQSLLNLANTADGFGGDPGNLLDCGLAGSGAAYRVNFQRPGGGAGWNGMIFVDYAHADPVRQAPGSTQLRPAPSGANEPRTGHVLALGQVGTHANPGALPFNNWNKSVAGGVAGTLPAPFNTAEVFSSELTPNPGNYLPVPNAYRVTLIASGNVFIQNHVLTHNIIRQVTTATGGFNINTVNTGLVRDNVLLSRGRDLFGVVADRQVVVGFATPTQTDRSLPGVVFTGAISALGDPSYSHRLNGVDGVYSGNADGVLDAVPAVGSAAYKTFSYRGSLATEGLIPLMVPNELEDYRIGGVVAGAWQLTGPLVPGAPLVNPNYIYTVESGQPIAVIGQLYTNPARNPNLNPRGKLVFFGSVIQRKRGVVGLGNRSFDKAYRYDQRLLSVAPPLFPNAINLVTYVSKVGLVRKEPGAGNARYRMPVYSDEEYQILNTPTGAPGGGSL